MASIASLDSTPRSSSNPATCTNRLTRHSSLPNLFLGQPELSIKALRKLSSPPHKCSRHSFPFCNDSPSLHTHSLCSKLPLCRALSTGHSFDELPHFAIPTADAHNLFSRSANAHNLFSRSFNACAGYPFHGSLMSPRKEALLSVAGKQNLDLEKSIVYSELKESMWRFEAPPRFLKPSDIYTEGNPCPTNHTHIHTHIHEPVKNPNPCMESSRISAKGRPSSLRKHKRKLSQVTPQVDYNMNPSKQLNEKCPSQAESNHDSKPRVFSDAYDSVSSAFTSLFYIMKMLQQHTHSLRIRSRPCAFESDQSCHENLVGSACAEMLDSFLWLFQQVFSRTPRLMLLTMMLLADFTLHSMSMHVAFPVRSFGEPPNATSFPLNIGNSGVMEATGIDADIYHHGHEEKRKVQIVPSKKREELLHGPHSGGGNGGHARTRFGESDAEDSPMPQTKTIAEGRAIVNGDNSHGGITFSSLSSPLIHHVHEKPSEFSSGLKEIDLDVPTKLLVAPVRAPILEADNYPCFDRTDLAYQQEISIDPSNPLLLANYAQFLHLVRRDYGRAEVLYKRAVSAEAEVDGEVMGKFASFLWVAKGDVAEADRAFKAATEADPTNAFHAGNYAHFLWNSSANQA